MGIEEDFERLWEGTQNYMKAQKFRNWLMQKVAQHGFKPTKENCKKYWLGELKRKSEL